MKTCTMKHLDDSGVRMPRVFEAKNRPLIGYSVDGADFQRGLVHAHKTSNSLQESCLSLRVEVHNTHSSKTNSE